GTLAADNKFIRIDHRVIDKPYLKRNLISYLPQVSFLPTNLTVKRVTGLYFKDQRIILDDDILSTLINTKISNLFGGLKRYLEIKMLLFSNSKFFLLDEPFNGVEPLLIDSIKDLIKERSLHKGIVLTDHDYRNVLTVANKYYLLYDSGLKQ